MSYSAAYSQERETFWARPHSLVFTWPVLLALLLLLLAGLVAIAHHCAPRRRLPSPRGPSALPVSVPSR